MKNFLKLLSLEAFD